MTRILIRAFAKTLLKHRTTPASKADYLATLAQRHGPQVAEQVARYADRNPGVANGR